MNVTFVLEEGRTFCLEVGFFDSFQEIKEKVEKYTDIPACRQTLVLDLNGQVLQNEALIFNTHISQESRVQFLVTSDSGNPMSPLPPPNRNEFEEMLLPPPETPLLPAFLRFEDDSEDALPPWNPDFTLYPPPPLPMPARLPPPPTRVNFTVKVLEYKARPFSIKMDLDDTVLKLKEKIYRMKKSRNLKPNEMLVRIKSGQELRDHWSMRDCGILDNSHVYVRKKSPQAKFTVPFSISGDAALGAKMLKVMVVPKGRTQKIPVEVNSFSRVEDLRYDLDRFYKHALPDNGCYFFTYKKNGHVMTETHAFNWYGIEDGDIIEITPEYLSF